MFLVCIHVVPRQEYVKFQLWTIFNYQFLCDYTYLVLTIARTKSESHCFARSRHTVTSRLLAITPRSTVPFNHYVSGQTQSGRTPKDAEGWPEAIHFVLVCKLIFGVWWLKCTKESLAMSSYLALLLHSAGIWRCGSVMDGRRPLTLSVRPLCVDAVCFQCHSFISRKCLQRSSFRYCIFLISELCDPSLWDSWSWRLVCSW